MAKNLFTIEEIEEAMKKELEVAKTEIKTEFDKTLNCESGHRSDEDIYKALLVLRGAEGFMGSVINRLKKDRLEEEEKKETDCLCDRCCLNNICNGDLYDGVRCIRFLAKF